MIKGLGKIIFISLTFLFVISVLNHSSYVEGVHDCSNMAVEQYLFLDYIGLDNINICVGDFKGYSHSWVKIGNYEYDPVSLFPMWSYKIGNEQIGNTRYYTYDTSIIHTSEHSTHLISYTNSIPTLFILIFFNILRITVIRKSLNHANA